MHGLQQTWVHHKEVLYKRWPRARLCPCCLFKLRFQERTAALRAQQARVQQTLMDERRLREQIEDHLRGQEAMIIDERRRRQEVAQITS